MYIIKLHTVDSTQKYLKKYIEKHTPENSVAVVAGFQTSGIGTNNTKWFSEKDKNLLFSIFHYNTIIDAKRFFDWNKAVSLALIYVLKDYYGQIRIKWPNDIMADGRKLAGFLTGSTVKNDKLHDLITGIGININQMTFPAGAGNPVSLRILTGKTYNLDFLADSWIPDMANHTEKLIKSSRFLHDEYISHLFLFNEIHEFKTVSGEPFTGKITGISHDGKLQIETPKGKLREFSMKEIQF